VSRTCFIRRHILQEDPPQLWCQRCKCRLPHSAEHSVVFCLSSKLRNDLKTTTRNSAVVCDITQCRLLDNYRNLSVIYNFHFQDWSHNSTFHIRSNFMKFPEFAGIIYRHFWCHSTVQFFS